MATKVFPPSVPVQAVRVTLRFAPFVGPEIVIEGMVEIPETGRPQVQSVSAFYAATIAEDVSLADVPWSFDAVNVDIPTYNNTVGARQREPRP